MRNTESAGETAMGQKETEEESVDVFEESTLNIEREDLRLCKFSSEHFVILTFRKMPALICTYCWLLSSRRCLFEAV